MQYVRDTIEPLHYLASESIHLAVIQLPSSTNSQDVSLLIGQYFREGPVSHYIRGGDWKMVRVDDNRVIEARSFVDAMKAEAIFDIGIILHRLKRKGIACPQCGQDDSENTVSTEEWVRWCVTYCLVARTYTHSGMTRTVLSKCGKLFHSADTISPSLSALPDSLEGV